MAFEMIETFSQGHLYYLDLEAKLSWSYDTEPQGAVKNLARGGQVLLHTPLAMYQESEEILKV